MQISFNYTGEVYLMRAHTKHFIADRVVQLIRQELDDRLNFLRSNNKLLEAQKIRTKNKL